MPRQPRLDHPGLVQHIIARGIERRRIFWETRDYEDFLKRLGTLFTTESPRCYAWALMPNHVHLLLRSSLQGISTFMHRLLTGYATTFNIRHHRAGHLFQNRYKNIVCEEEPYFLELVRYIHLNPLRAGLVKTLEDLAGYPWTGHAVLMGQHQRAWQAVQEVLARFGRSPEEGRRAYERFVADGLPGGAPHTLTGGGLRCSLGGLPTAMTAHPAGTDQCFDARILGTGEFVEHVRQMVGDLHEPPANGWKRWGLTLEKLLEGVSRWTGVNRTQLTTKGRPASVSAAKAMVIFLGTDYLGQSKSAMARLTKMSPTAAGKAHARGKVLLDQFPLHAELRKLVD